MQEQILVQSQHVSYAADESHVSYANESLLPSRLSGGLLVLVLRHV
jgi:hypothetical protein